MKLNLEDLYNYITHSLSDNGDWEYTREGIGVYNNQTFVVDLDDTGDDERELLFVKKGLTVEDVLQHGIASGSYVCEQGEYC